MMTSNSPVSPTIEEYLENIYRLEEEYGVARTKLLAERVGVTLGTITNTIQALERRNLVTHEPYRGVKLTEAGRQLALDVLRRHRLSERLLTDILEIEWSQAHDYACQLEHAFSSDLTKPLERVLGHPKTCPHGNPVPAANGTIVDDPSQPLTALNRGQTGIVQKIVKERREYLEYLLRMKLVPGAKVTVLEKAPFDGPITLEINGETRTLGRNMASIVWIKVTG